MIRKFLFGFVTVVIMLSLVLSASSAFAADPSGKGLNYHGKVTQAERKAAADNFKAAVAAAAAAGVTTTTASLVLGPKGYLIPDYFGVANWAYSPAPTVDPVSGTVTGGIRKFIDKLPQLGSAGANALGQYIPVAVADTTTSSGSDYYEIALVEYEEQMHSDLPKTRLRGYVQLSTAVVPGDRVALTNPDGTPIMMPDGVTQAVAVDNPHYLGPSIVSTSNRPTRIKFYNLLPTGAGGDLFIPVDETVMGSGEGPVPGVNYTQNRATVHLHGNNTVWISDGTPYQWITPANESTPYPEGVSVYNVPDMPDPGSGAETFFYTNAQSARLMFYHDHAVGITRLNVYAGEAAGYIIQDEVEKDLINGTNNTGVNPGLDQVLPDIGIPLVIQDRTFVDANTVLKTDPTWAWGTGAVDPVTGYPAPKTGDLWYPHVYMPAQNPWDPTGVNAFGRWMYGPWFYPPTANVEFGPVPNEYYQPDPNLPNYAPWEPPMRPGTPNPSMPGEAFMDTSVVNGTAYPYLEVEPTAYRFRILNAANDRFFNLQLYEADPNVVTADGRTNTEVKMISAAGTPGLPADWAPGVPDPTMKGPDLIQVGTEGGFLPKPVVIPSQPLTWNLNATTFNFGVVDQKSLLLGCAERADVIVDFSAYAGKTLILYNDAPAAFPAYVPQYDYYTGAPDQTANGGAPTTLAGYGPNTRSIMQIRVGGGGSNVSLASVNVTAGGSGYTEPMINFVNAVSDTTGTGAAAQATGVVDRIVLNSMVSGYTTAPTVTIAPPTGGGTQAKATAIVTNGFVTGITLTNGGSGYTTAPMVAIDPPDGGTPALAKATLAVTNIDLINVGSGYTSAPIIVITDQTGTGGGAGAVAILAPAAPSTPYDVATLETVWAKGITPSAKRGVFEVSQAPIIIPQAAYNSAYGYSGVGADTLPSAPVDTFVQIFEYAKTFQPIDETGALQAPVTLPIQPKAMHDEMGGVYDTMYGRMSGILGLEIPATTSRIAQFLPYGYASPPVDIIKDTDMLTTPMGTLKDGTQIWKITHNGVDTHPIHVHLFTAQLINRVAWDGIMMGVDDNELGWKETFRVNPLEQIIIALRPIAPTPAEVPFEVPNSRRLIDPSLPEGAVLNAPAPAGWFDPAGTAIPQILNHYVNLGWEYVYHCHILAHEEMDMMHVVSFAVPPKAPFNLAVTMLGNKAKLTWTDNSITETGFTIQRATNAGFTTNLVTYTVGANTTTFQDPNQLAKKTTYYYRIIATNTVGDAMTPGFPTITANSAPSNVVTIIR
jgi:FtsP/CotA-like multicopper oxidase with cupredoxin domain